MKQSPSVELIGIDKYGDAHMLPIIKVQMCDELIRIYVSADHFVDEVKKLSRGSR